MIIGVLLGLLIEAGTEVRSMLTKASNDWNALFCTSDFLQLEGKLDSIVSQIKGGAIPKAIDELQVKKLRILNGRDPSALAAAPNDRHAYLALLKVEQALCLKELAEAQSSRSLAQTLVNALLPSIEHAAPIVLALFV